MRTLTLLIVASLLCVRAGAIEPDERPYVEGHWSYNQSLESRPHNPDDCTFHVIFYAGYYEFGGGSGGYEYIVDETGNYTVSADSVFITLTESNIPERIGLSFVTTWAGDVNDGFHIGFTNAPVLTANLITENTVTLMASVTGIHEEIRSWGRIKLLYK